jgi:PAS domain S-box-containing protein
VLLAAHFLLLPAAIGTTTTVLILLVLTIICVFVARRRAVSRTAADVGGAKTSPDQLEPELAKRLIADAEWSVGVERYRTPLDQIENYAIVLLDTKGKPTSWNTGIRRVLGYERAEFLQTAAADLYPADARQSGAPAADLAEAARRGQFTTERWLLRKDGSRFWASVSTTSVHDRDGRLLGFARRLRDLSEDKAVGEQLRRKQEALELALEAAGLGTWEHDLSTGGDSMDARPGRCSGFRPTSP